MKPDEYIQEKLQSLVKNVAGAIHALFGTRDKIDLCLSFKHPNETILRKIRDDDRFAFWCSQRLKLDIKGKVYWKGPDSSGNFVPNFFEIRNN